MAKAVLPADALLGSAQEPPKAADCQGRIVERFLRALGANGGSG